jgi:hypothetical protein
LIVGRNGKSLLSDNNKKARSPDTFFPPIYLTPTVKDNASVIIVK